MPGAGRTHGPPATKNAGGSHHRQGRSNPAFPARRFTAYTWSPRSAGLVSLRRSRERLARSLTPASGRRDRTISLVRAPSLVAPGLHVHRILLPTLVTIGRSAPTGGSRTGRDKHSFRKNGSEILRPLTGFCEPVEVFLEIPALAQPLLSCLPKGEAIAPSPSAVARHFD